MDLQINPSNVLLVVFLGALSTAVAEILNYVLVYRKDEYRMLVANIASMTKKIEKMEEVGASKTQEKKKQQLEERLKTANAELGMKKFKSTFVVGLIMIGAITYFSNYFSGVTVAKLPFVPIGLIQGLSHRGLEGTDYTDCSFIFIYILTGIVLRTNIQKMFGFEGPQNNFNPFMNPSTKF